MQVRRRITAIVLGLLVATAVGTEPAGAASSCSGPTRVVLVRHAQTHWNALGILQGNADVPLDETGRAQAGSLARDMAGMEIAAVYSSPLSRAYETALAIAASRSLPVARVEAFREIGVGIYTGYAPGRIPGATRDAWRSDPEFAMPSGAPDAVGVREPAWVEGRTFEGESLRMVAARAWRGLREVVGRHCGQNVAVVTHGGVIQLAVLRARGQPLTDYGTVRVGNVSRTVLEFAPDGSARLVPAP